MRENMNTLVPADASGRIVWAGQLIDGLDKPAKLRVRVIPSGTQVFVEEYLDGEDAEPLGPGWRECEDAMLTMDAFAMAVLALAGSP
jgi:hypothetical protein